MKIKSLKIFIQVHTKINKKINNFLSYFSYNFISDFLKIYFVIVYHLIWVAGTRSKVTDSPILEMNNNNNKITKRLSIKNIKILLFLPIFFTTAEKNASFKIEVKYIY